MPMDDYLSEKFKHLEVQAERNTISLDKVAMELHTVGTDLRVLNERLGGFNQMYQDQVKGLTGLENRQTITDKRIGDLDTKIIVLESNSKNDKEEIEKRIGANRWLISISITLLMATIAVITFFGQHFKF